MKNIFCLILTVVFLLSGGQFISAAMDSSNYQIWADVISVGGGENGSSAGYNLYDTLGEGIIGQSSSTNYSSRAGFREMVKDASANVLTLTVGSNSLSLGNLSSAATGSSSHTMTVETNSATGLSVAFSGSTLTCGACGGTNTVTAIGPAAVASTAGTSQFGFNVIYDSGDLTASAQAPYNGAATYAFNSGDEIISAAAAMSGDTIFDVTYIANISGAETAGSYSTAITYTATANF